MARRRRAQKRSILPDPKFGNLLLAKFINILMFNGKKSVAENIVYRSLDTIKNKGHKDPLEVFKTSLENIQPVVEVKSRRVGGSTYQVPVEVTSDRQKTLAIRWIIDGAKKRSDKGMQQRLSSELLDAYDNKGFAFKKKEDVRRMAEANKAFSHFRW